MVDIRDEMMERLLAEAGIRAGMRVLDVGCGRGDVSFMIARLVGGQGHVLGLDLDPNPLGAAREQARELGFLNITFTEDDIGDLSPEHGSFDAIVGRRVLMYQADPVHVLKQLVRVLRSGGLVVFQEHDSTPVADGRGLFPLHDQVQAWIWETVKREGGNSHMGLDLYSVLSAVGLSVEKVRAEAVVRPPGSPYPYEPIIRAMFNRIIQKSVASEEEIDIDTLDQRLVAEHEKANTVYIGDMVFSAWARKQG